MKNLIVFFILIISSCKVFKSNQARTALRVYMTDQQQTDAIIELQKKLVGLNTKQFKKDITNTISLADTVRINVLVAARAYITKTGLMSEEDTLRNKQIINDAKFVREFLERRIDSLQNIIDKK